MNVRLRWKDNSKIESNFIVERCRGKIGEFLVIATLGPNIITYLDKNVKGKTIRYRVKAHHQFGDSPYSNIATIHK